MPSVSVGIKKEGDLLKFSTRSEYGLRAMVVLAGVRDSSPLSLRQIAETELISEQYLEQIFMDLRKAELVQSVRGAYGGYYLARDPEEITVKEILEVLEGPIFHYECLAGENSTGGCNFKEEPCLVQIVWKRMQESMTDVLDGMNLKGLQEGSYI